MSAVAIRHALTEIEAPERWRPVHVAVWCGVSVIVSAAAAFLISRGLWFVVPVGLLVVPGFVLLHRRPMSAIAIWLAIAPLVAVTDSGAVRAVFWLVHRALPLGTLAIIVIASAVGVSERKLPRLGLPEVLMASYVGASLLSIVYASDQPVALSFILYDRVAVPMFLYLIVRLVEPDEWQVRGLLPVVILLLLTQVAIGLLMWTAPGVLPDAWLNHQGSRTTGSFDDPNSYGSTLVFCAMVMLTAGLAVRRSIPARVGWLLLFIVAMLMVFMTLGRASWIAGGVALLAGLAIFRGLSRWLIAIVLPLAMVLAASGILAQQVDFAKERLRSPQSAEEALSRLPAVVAAVRMFELKPIAGWGYDNFDRFSRPFQSRVGNLISAEKPRASHNLYLTLLAEQGVTGFALFVAPTVVWLWRTKRVARRMPMDGFTGKRFLGAMWLTVIGFYICNNFAVMHVTFPLGLWWLTLGLVASLVHRHRPTSMPTSTPVARFTGATGPADASILEGTAS